MGPIRRFFDDFYYVRYELAVLSVLLATALGLFALSYWEDQRRIEPALQRAEACSEESPEEFRAMLDSLSPRFWWHPERQARYALLYSKALDKTLVDLKSDSLIITAVNYYAATDHPRYRMLAFYYAGRVAQNSQHTARAYAYFSLADQLADSLKEYHTGGLIARNLAEIHNLSNNFREELLFAQKALDRFAQAGSTLHADYMYYPLGNALYSNQRYDEAIENYRRGIEIFSKNNDTLYLSMLYREMAGAYLAKGNFALTKKILSDVHHIYRYPQDVRWLIDYAAVCAYFGKIDSATYYLNKADREAQDGIDHAHVVIRKTYIDDIRISRLKGAPNITPRLRSVDSLMRYIYATPIKLDSLKDFIHQTKTISQQLETRTRSYTQQVYLLTSLVFVLVVWMRIRKYRHRKEVESYMVKLMSIRENLLEKEARMSELGAAVYTQLQERFGPINQLSEIYYLHQNSHKEKEKIFKEVQQSIHNISQPSYTRENLEPLINQNFGGLFGRMREQLPELREVDFQIISYLCCGFSYQAIALFLQLDVMKIYKRIYRLRERIQNSNAPDRAEFLQRIVRK